jgi:HEAT repeats
MSTETANALNLDQLRTMFDQPSSIVQQLSSVLLSFTQADEETRAWAADCLEQVNSISESVAAEISPLTEHSCEYVVNWTCRMLGKAANVSSFQRQLVKVLASHPSIGVQQTAVLALQGVQVANDETKAALRKAALSTDPRLQRLAQEALQGLK